jgi:Ca2+-binding EF-hand superfamily protein
MTTDEGALMTRGWGAGLLVLAAGALLTNASAQDTKKGKVDVDAVFKKLDANGDNKLQKDEFLKLADHFKDKGKAREKLSTAFGAIDADKRGYLSRDQFRVYFETAKKRVEQH